MRWTGEVVVKRGLDVTCCVSLECLPENVTESHRSSRSRRSRFSLAWHDAGSLAHLSPSTKLCLKPVFQAGCR